MYLKYSLNSYCVVILISSSCDINFFLLRYAIITKCWESNPEVRPTFSQQVENLSSLLSSMADYLDIFTISNPAAASATPIPSAPPLEETNPLNDDDGGTRQTVINYSVADAPPPVGIPKPLVNPYDDDVPSCKKDSLPMLIHEDSVIVVKGGDLQDLLMGKDIPAEVAPNSMNIKTMDFTEEDEQVTAL